MNIVELHERVRFWVDETSSPRFDEHDIDQAINISVENIVQEYYDRDRVNNPYKSVQSSQKVRDTLMPLEKLFTFNGGNIINGKILKSAFPDDYWVLLSLTATLSDGEVLPLKATDYNHEQLIERNPYKRPRSGAFKKAYYNEEDTGIRVVIPEGKMVASIKMYYLAMPSKVSYGITITSFTGTVDIPVIVTSATFLYNGMNYYHGDQLTILQSVGSFAGTAVKNYVNPILPELVHEEIAIRSAANLLTSVSMIEKANNLIQKTISK